MLARQIKSYQELSELVLYSAEKYKHPMLPTDTRNATARIYNHIKSGGFCRVIEDEGEPVAYGIASEGSHYIHSRAIILSAMYYHTMLEGRKAVRALTLFHEEMVDYAIKRKLAGCTSGSILPNFQVYNRILEKAGWIQQGSSMYYPLNNPMKTKTFGTR